MHEDFRRTFTPCIHLNTMQQLARSKGAEDRGKTFSSRSSSKTWAYFVSGAKLNPEHSLPAVQPRCLQSPEIKTWKSGLMKHSSSGIQGTGGGSCCFQKNRVGMAPRQGTAPFHQSGSRSNIWQNFTLMKKIVAEAKSRWNATPKQCSLIFQDGSAWLSFLLYIFSEQQRCPALLWRCLCTWIQALHLCVSLWIRCCSLIPHKNHLLLSVLVLSAINWLPGYLINLLSETS